MTILSDLLPHTSHTTSCSNLSQGIIFCMSYSSSFSKPSSLDLKDIKDGEFTIVLHKLFQWFMRLDE